MNRKKIIAILAVSVLLIAFSVGAAAADDTPKMTTAASSSTNYLNFQPIASLEEMKAGFKVCDISEEFFEKTAENITLTKTSEGNVVLNGELGYCEKSEIPYSDGSNPSGYFTAYKIILPDKYSDIKKDAIYVSSVSSKGETATMTGEDISKDYAGSDNAVIYIIVNLGPYSDGRQPLNPREYLYYKGGVSDISTAANVTKNNVTLSPDLVTSVRTSTVKDLIRYASTNDGIIAPASLLKTILDKDMKAGYDDFKEFGFPKETKEIEKTVQGYLVNGATLTLENFSTGDKQKDAERLKELTNAHWINGLQIVNGKVAVSDTLGLYAAIYTMKINGDVVTTADITYNGTKIPAGSTIKSKGDSTVTVISPDGKQSTMNVALNTTTSPGFGILAVLAGLGAVAIPAVRKIRK